MTTKTLYNYNHTRKYRTECSIKDSDMNQIIDLMEEKIYPGINEFNRTNDNHTKDYVFLDFGCHMGHLAIELAIRYPIRIFAVDNFRGTPGDQLMDREIMKHTSSLKDFHHVLIHNIDESRHLFKGEVIPMYPRTFFSLSNLHINFAFIDSDHKSSIEFVDIDRLIPSGGILGGHDFNVANPETRGVTDGIRYIQNNYTWIYKNYTFFMRKK